MTTIYMDVIAMREAEKYIKHIQEQLLESSRSIDWIVAAIETYWEAPSQVEFYNLYIDFKKDFLNKLDNLTELSKKLSNEIQQWEDMSYNLSAGYPSGGPH